MSYPEHQLDSNCWIELGHFVFHTATIPWILLPLYYTGERRGKNWPSPESLYICHQNSNLLISPSFCFEKSSPRKPGLLVAPGCKNYNCIRDHKPWDQLGGGEKDLPFFLPLPKNSLSSPHAMYHTEPSTPTPSLTVGGVKGAWTSAELFWCFLEGTWTWEQSRWGWNPAHILPLLPNPDKNRTGFLQPIPLPMGVF